MDFIFDPSLVLYLPLYKLDGASFMSRDAYGHTCTVIGASWRPNGRYFDGSDDYISIPHNTLFNFGTGDFTIITWVNYQGGAGDTDYIVAKTKAGLAPGFVVYVAGNKVNFWGNDCAGLSSTTAPVGAGWLQATVSRISGSHKMYINGIEEASGAATGDVDTAYALRIGIGNDLDTEWLSGIVGELIIYKGKGLNPLEIQHNYLATKWRYR